jgi:hypothetical protein
MTLAEIKQQAKGNWESIAVEIRPGSTKNADGTLKPFYLTRKFKLSDDDVFELAVNSYADPFGKIALATIFMKGRIVWRDEHPVADGAYKVDFSASTEFTFTSLNPNVPAFKLPEGQVFKEYGLIYMYGDFMFWGARNIDGRGFDTEENRPTNLQIPMRRA